MSVFLSVDLYVCLPACMLYKYIVYISLVLFYKFNLLEVCRGPREDLEC